MPPIAHERYDALVAKLRGMAEKQGEEGEPPEAVARVIATALTTPRPRTRYVVGRSARIQAGLARALPGRAMDRVLAKALA